MVYVRFNIPENLVSCENFLSHAFPGEVERKQQVLALQFRGGSLDPTAQRKIVERLLWAWRISHKLDTDDGYIVAFDQTDARRR